MVEIRIRYGYDLKKSHIAITTGIWRSTHGENASCGGICIRFDWLIQRRSGNDDCLLDSSVPCFLTLLAETALYISGQMWVSFRPILWKGSYPRRDVMPDKLTRPTEVTDPEVIAEICRFRARVWKEIGKLKDDAFGDDGWRDPIDSRCQHWVIRTDEGRLVAAGRLSMHDTLDDVHQSEEYRQYGVDLTGVSLHLTESSCAPQCKVVVWVVRSSTRRIRPLLNREHSTPFGRRRRAWSSCYVSEAGRSSDRPASTRGFLEKCFRWQWSRSTREQAAFTPRSDTEGRLTPWSPCRASVLTLGYLHPVGK